MTNTTTRRLAHLTWLAAPIYLVVQWLVALRLGVFAAQTLVLLLAAAGCICAFVCLRQASRRGWRGILVPAIAGLLLNFVPLVVAIPSIVRT